LGINTKTNYFFNFLVLNEFEDEGVESFGDFIADLI
jgi:hypothetical protein